VHVLEAAGGWGRTRGGGALERVPCCFWVSALLSLSSPLRSPQAIPNLSLCGAAHDVAAVFVKHQRMGRTSGDTVTWQPYGFACAASGCLGVSGVSIGCLRPLCSREPGGEDVHKQNKAFFFVGNRGNRRYAVAAS